MTGEIDPLDWLAEVILLAHLTDSPAIRFFLVHRRNTSMTASIESSPARAGVVSGAYAAPPDDDGGFVPAAPLVHAAAGRP
jgi:hypothetical protein